MLRASKYLIFSCALSMLFARCFDDNLKEIQLGGQVYLLQSEGNSDDGFDIVLKSNDHSSTVLVEANPVEIHYTPSQILVKRDDRGLLNYYKISMDNEKTNNPEVVELKEKQFDEEVKDCADCKKINLILDTDQHEWKIKR